MTMIHMMTKGERWACLPHYPYHTINDLYHTIPYPTIPYNYLYHYPYHTIPYYNIHYLTIHYHTIPYYTISLGSNKTFLLNFSAGFSRRCSCFWSVHPASRGSFSRAVTSRLRRDGTCLQTVLFSWNFPC